MTDPKTSPAVRKLVRDLSRRKDARLTRSAGNFYYVCGVAKPRLVPRRIAKALIASGLLTPSARDMWAATPEMESWLKRFETGADGFREQHSIFLPVPGNPSREARINPSECPVARLAQRKQSDGSAYLTPDLVEAADRLRHDFERGNLNPSVTMNWSSTSTASGRRRHRDEVDRLTDMALASRARLRKALKAVGPEFADLLMDVCCFLKGLEIVESERRWPARSAKLVLRLALKSLARHYGFAPEATGPAKTSRHGHGRATGYRPTIDED